MNYFSVLSAFRCHRVCRIWAPRKGLSWGPTLLPVCNTTPQEASVGIFLGGHFAHRSANCYLYRKSEITQQAKREREREKPQSSVSAGSFQSSLSACQIGPSQSCIFKAGCPGICCLSGDRCSICAPQRMERHSREEDEEGKGRVEKTERIGATETPAKQSISAI